MQDHDTEPTPTIVRSAEELQSAVITGKAHIQIREHLDLTVLDIIDSESFDCLLGKIPPTVKSIRVRISCK